VKIKKQVRFLYRYFTTSRRWRSWINAQVLIVMVASAIFIAALAWSTPRTANGAGTRLEPLTRDIEYATPETAWGNLGWAYLSAGDVDRAIVALRHAVALQPEFCFGHYWLGVAYEKKNDLRSARDLLSRALNTDRPQCKGLQDAYAARARIELRLGEADGARSDLERCRELGSDTTAGRECAALMSRLR
jgi:tetratricopeptide (TPR) repeat protein